MLKKRPFFLLLIIYLIFIALTACSNPAVSDNTEGDFDNYSLTDKSSKKWLFLFYFCGDDSSSNLYANLKNNIAAISRGLSECNAADVKAVVFLDGPEKNESNYVFEIKPDSSASSSALSNITEPVSVPELDSSEVNSGSYKTLSKFLQTAFNRFNADKSYTTVLVIGSHGIGSFGNSAKTVALDFDSNSFITTSQMVSAFDEAGIKKSNRIDLMIYDSCVTGTIEEAYEIKDYAKSVVFSPHQIPVAGLQYEKFLTQLKSDSSISEAGTLLVNLYAENYNKKTNAYTLTFVDLSKIKEVKNCIQSYASFFLKTENSSYLQILNGTKYKFLVHKNDSSINEHCDYESIYVNSPAESRSLTESNYYTYDLGYLSKKTKEYALEKGNVELAAICDNLITSLENAIISSWKGLNGIQSSSVTDQQYLSGSYPLFDSAKNYFGLAIAGLSDSSSEAVNIYEKSDFSFNRDTNWGNLLSLICK